MVAAILLGACASPPATDAGTDASVDLGAPDATPDVSPDPDAFTPAPHDMSPPLHAQSGPVFSHPAIVTVTFSNDTRRDALEAFATQMAGDVDWWTATTQEYGVGPVTVLAPLRLTMDAPATIDQAGLDAMWSDLATSGMLPSRGGSYDGIVFMLYIPSGAHVNFTDVGPSCGAWHGDHRETAIGSSRIAWVVTADCGPNRGFDALNYIEVGASHELIETVTDPFPNSMPAYLANPATPDPWSVFTELTDRCVGQYVRRTGYAVAQSWSNAAAAMGGDPCVPVPMGAPYYNVTRPMASVDGAPGSTIDVALTGWSSAPVPDFHVAAYASGGFNTSPRIDDGTLNNGVSSVLHVAIPSNAPSGSHGWVIVMSGPSFGDARNFPILVTAD